MIITGLIKLLVVRPLVTVNKIGKQAENFSFRKHVVLIDDILQPYQLSHWKRIANKFKGGNIIRKYLFNLKGYTSYLTII